MNGVRISQILQTSYKAVRRLQNTSRIISAKIVKIPSCTCHTQSSDVNKGVPLPKKTTVLYDGECPICIQEIRMAKYLNRKKQKLDFVDVSKPNFNPANHSNVSYTEAMDVFHVIDEDAKVHKGVDAMVKMYRDIGYGWSVNFLRSPRFSSLSDRLYSWFAKNRLKISGRKVRDTSV